MKKKHIPIIISVIISLLLVCAGAFFMFPQKYFYDNIVAIAIDSIGQDVLIDVEMTRQQTFFNYQHYYKASVLSKGAIYHDQESFSSWSADIQPHRLFNSFSNEKNKESADETYSFRMQISGIDITVATGWLEGDFLVKNTLEYLRYDSAGTATVWIGGEKLVANIRSDKILSNDAAELSVDYGSIKRTNNSITLWDEKGTMYHIDHADVKTVTEKYPSHSWVLVKDQQAGAVYKYQQARLQYLRDEYGNVQQWTIDLPEFDNMQFVIDRGPVISTTAIAIDSVVYGRLQESAGSRRVRGYAHIEEIQ